MRLRTAATQTARHTRPPAAHGSTHAPAVAGGKTACPKQLSMQIPSWLLFPYYILIAAGWQRAKIQVDEIGSDRSVVLIDQRHDQLRAELKERGIFLLNLMSAPARARPPLPEVMAAIIPGTGLCVCRRSCVMIPEALDLCGRRNMDVGHKISPHYCFLNLIAYNFVILFCHMGTEPANRGD